MTDTVRVSREAVEEIADDLRAISLELTKKQATIPVSEDIFRKAVEALEAMLAASPQGEASSADADHIGEASPADTDVGKLIQAPLVEKLVEALKFARDEAGRGLDREPTIASLVLIKDRAERALDHVAYTHPAPIKPFGDTGELREKVARLAWTYSCSSEPFDPEADHGWSRALDLYANDPRYTRTRSSTDFVDRTWAFADAILDLIQSERLNK